MPVSDAPAPEAAGRSRSLAGMSVAPESRCHPGICAGVAIDVDAAATSRLDCSALHRPLRRAPGRPSARRRCVIAFDMTPDCMMPSTSSSCEYCGTIGIDVPAAADAAKAAIAALSPSLIAGVGRDLVDRRGARHRVQPLLAEVVELVGVGRPLDPFGRGVRILRAGRGGEAPRIDRAARLLRDPARCRWRTCRRAAPSTASRGTARPARARACRRATRPACRAARARPPAPPCPRRPSSVMNSSAAWPASVSMVGLPLASMMSPPACW